MIREEELQEAIAECQGEKNPNANTCIKLASYLTILDHQKAEEPKREIYSYAPPQAEMLVDMSFSDTEFAEAVDGKKAEDVWRLMDELMTTLQVINPRLYNSVMRKLND